MPNDSDDFYTYIYQILGRNLGQRQREEELEEQRRELEQSIFASHTWDGKPLTLNIPTSINAQAQVDLTPKLEPIEAAPVITGKRYAKHKNGKVYRITYVPFLDIREQYQTVQNLKNILAYHMKNTQNYRNSSHYMLNRRALKEARKNLRSRTYHINIKRIKGGKRDLLINYPIKTYDACEREEDLHTTAKVVYDALKYNIKIRRNSAKQPGGERRTYWNLCGGVHLRDNEIGSKKDTIKKDRTYVDKKPKTKDRHIAVEIEFVCNKDQNAVSDAIVAFDLDKYVTVKGDGSVGPSCGGKCCRCGENCGGTNCRCNCPEFKGDKGHEIACIMQEKEYPKIIRRVCRMLNNIDAYVNKTCGLHVHLDMRDRDAKLAYKNLFNAQGLLMSLVPKSRRGNKYCQPIDNGDINRLPRERYNTINGHALLEHNTIEVRLHTGSVDAKKICYWMALLIRIVNAPSIPKCTDQLPELKKSIKLSPRLCNYLDERIKKFIDDKIEDEAA